MKMMTILAGILFIVGICFSGTQSMVVPGPCNDPFVNPLPDIPLCEQIEDSVKCFIRDIGFHDDPDTPEGFVEAFQEQLDNSLSTLEETCDDIDVDDLLEEVRQQELDSSDPDCVDDDSEDPCEGRNNGDYLICDDSKCAAGKYITCSNQILHVRDCATGWYRDYDGNRFLAPTVYNPPSGRCETLSAACPRELDNFVEE